MLNVGCKLSCRNFGAKVSFCFPRGEDFDDHAAALKKILARHADRIEALLLSGELDAVFEGRRGAHVEDLPAGYDGDSPNEPVFLQKVGAVGATAEGADVKDEGSVSESSGDVARCFKEWPSVGMVTARDIVGFWNIGNSSFRNRVREGGFSAAVACPDRAPNAPKVWSAAVVGAELARAGYVRRGFGDVCL